MTYRASQGNFQSKNLEYSKLFIYIAIFKTEQQQELVLYISWTFHSKYFLTIWTMCSYFDPIWMWCPLVTETPSVVGVSISFVTHIGATTPISRKWSRCSNLRFLRSWHHLCWIAGDSDGSSFEHFVGPAAALLTGPRVEHRPHAERPSQGPLPVWQSYV